MVDMFVAVFVVIVLVVAVFNITSNTNAKWKDNFFEGIPSPAGGIILLFPLIFSFSGLGEFFKINYVYSCYCLTPRNIICVWGSDVT